MENGLDCLGEEWVGMEGKLVKMLLSQLETELTLEGRRWNSNEVGDRCKVGEVVRWCSS